MLGKRCRTLQRTASISQNMGPHYLHRDNHQQCCQIDLTGSRAKGTAENCLINSPFQATDRVPAIIPQIIGFNPVIKSDHSPQRKVFCSPDHPGCQTLPPLGTYDGDPDCIINDHLHQKIAGPGTAGGIDQGLSKRSQITPTSALRTLLAAAARQITGMDHPPPPTLRKNESCCSFSLIKASAASPSSNAASISADKQGILQVSPSSTGAIKKRISADQSLINEVRCTTDQIKIAATDGYNCVSLSDTGSEQNIFYEDGACNSARYGRRSLESVQKNRHALYLATSPLGLDLMPSFTASMSFLESCYLCKRRLGHGRDIFIYRGESAFCSVECRDKQMRMEKMNDKVRSMGPLKLQNHNNRQKEEGIHINTETPCAAPHHHPHHQHSARSDRDKPPRSPSITWAALL